MSVVIAIKDKNKIILGCDSQVTQGGNKNVLSKDSCKIFNIKNCPNGILGSVGGLRESQILQCQDNLIDELKILKNEINYKYCVLDLFDKIYKVLLNKNMIYKKDAEYVNYTNNEFIFAYKDTAFLISAFGCIVEIEDYLVIGSGEEVAIGVLENNKNKTPETRIREAIKVCSEKTLYIDNNVKILSTI